MQTNNRHRQSRTRKTRSVGLDLALEPKGALPLTKMSDFALTSSPKRQLSLSRAHDRQSERVLTNLPMPVHRPEAGVRRVRTLPEERRFPMTLDLSRKDVQLPFGVPRFINAATLRAIAGGRRSDQLLKKVGGAWEFVEDDTMIDLTNPREEFRLGRLNILS
jgi:hypothetical protein